MISSAASLWFTAAEVAQLGISGLPRSTRRVHEWAAAEEWERRTADDGTPLARPRRARGGGTEYHVSLFPPPVREALTAHNATAAAPAVEPSIRDDHWQWFDQQSSTTKATAEKRAAILAEVDVLREAGAGKTVAIDTIAQRHDVSPRAVAGWSALVRGVAPQDRLPRLAPVYKGGGKEAEIDAALWQYLLSDFLRLSGPSWATCVRRTRALGDERKLTLPDEKTLWRRFEKQVPREVVVLKREGIDALRKNLPPQKRTVADLHALELVNIDGHTCDVRVQFPDGRIGRPTLIAIQDVYSRKFLAWRFATSEDAITARLCFADLFAKYGIPKGLLSDNGRAFACKWLTGGAPTRFRFKVKPEDPVGLLTNLGVKIHWALPFRGSSKPIERGFRDFCDGIAKHPAFEGAYTGNNALNKPDNYGERSVPWETFVAVWTAGIHAHNAQPGRRTEMGLGKHSFDQVFDASYASAPIGKATAEQLRLALYAAEQVRADRKTGTVKLLGNVYWAAELASVAGELLTVRFDPEDTRQPIHVYASTGKFIGTADLWQADGFLDAAAAKHRAKLIADHRKAAKAAASARGLLQADQLAAMLPAYEDEAPTPEPMVLRPVRMRGATAAALKSAPSFEQAVTPATPSFTDRFTAAVERRFRVVE